MDADIGISRRWPARALRSVNLFRGCNNLAKHVLWGGGPFAPSVRSVEWTQVLKVPTPGYWGVASQHGSGRRYFGAVICQIVVSFVINFLHISINLVADPHSSGVIDKSVTSSEK